MHGEDGVQGGELGSRRLWSANAAGYWSVREEEIRECEGGGDTGV